jgi:hypothetical protein
VALVVTDNRAVVGVWAETDDDVVPLPSTTDVVVP